MERRRLLLDTAFGLLDDDGWSCVTVRAVCHGARLNPRYFYESFADLDELVVALYDRLIEELGGRVEGAMRASGDEPSAQFRAAIDGVVTFVDEDRRRARILYVDALGNEALNRRRIETTYAVVASVEQFAADRVGAPPDGEHIGRIGAAVVVGGASELIMAWLDGRIEVTREQLVDDATALFLAIGQAATRLAAQRLG